MLIWEEDWFPGEPTVTEQMLHNLLASSSADLCRVDMKRHWKKDSGAAHGYVLEAWLWLSFIGSQR